MNRCFVIAEAGVNHNGDADLALKLVDAAADAGADAVKFQTFTAGKLVARGTAKAAYQEANTGGGDQYSMLLGLELKPADYPRLRARAAARGIEFMSTPFDTESAAMLVGMGMQKLKIPSGEITNFPFLLELVEFGLPLILSTGMATLEEVQEAVTAIEGACARRGRARPGLTLLHCTSNYPAKPEEVNLRAMQTMREHFDLPVGYSDHTEGTAASIAAAALGARVVEKHFTLSRAMPGPDHRASVEPEELKLMVQQIREVEAMCAAPERLQAFIARIPYIETLRGSAEKRPCAAELPIKALVRRSVTLARGLKANARIARADVALLRPGTGIPPRDLERVVGMRVVADFAAGRTLTWGDVAP